MTRATQALRKHPNTLLVASLLLMGVYFGMVLSGGSVRSSARMEANITAGRDYLCSYPGCENRVAKQGEFCKLHAKEKPR